MKRDKRPMYQVILDDLKDKISNGEITNKDAIPTQIELAKIYQTSEITSRRALVELANDGYIYRVRGKGSFINEDSNQKKNVDENKLETIYLVHSGISMHVFNHVFFADLLLGLYEKCNDHQIVFRMWNIQEKLVLPEESKNSAFVLLAGSHDGVTISTEFIDLWREENRRFVTVHFFFPHIQVPYVIVDNLTGGYLATQHLLSLGHRRIGIVVSGNSPLDINQEFTLRLQGYKLALSIYNIEFESSLVVVVTGSNEETIYGFEGFNRLMDLEAPPSAIFMTTDLSALGAIEAADRRGLDIPGDVSIVGYDNLFLGTCTHPKLTTINQNTLQVGKRAVELLIEEWVAGGTGMRKDEIVPSLIIRGSTAEFKGINLSLRE